MVLNMLIFSRLTHQARWWQKVQEWNPATAITLPVWRKCAVECSTPSACRDREWKNFCMVPNTCLFLRRSGATVVVNIWGKTIEEYGEVAARIEAEKEGIDALEINISCPNVKEGGVAFGTDLKLAAQVVAEVRKSTKLPLMTKLSPNVTKIADFTKAVEAEGSDMVSLINTITGMAIDINTRRPKIANITGGLSGPAIKPVAVRMVYEVAKAVNIPIIGMGGIMNAADAIEFILAGASAIAVGTAIFVDPMAPIKVIAGINEYLDKNNIACVGDIVGKVQIQVICTEA
eukprot:TRINITY_DN6563_c0_g1_i1.p1 TRINITY_DN6563_c0_g1~~TRINITY_DN6563_c0_g1_i1.p1  ORF type:complete len:289 (+),score=49.00 TRINITY_DN6563_c0_g1_i1:1490-2356(+)